MGDLVTLMSKGPIKLAEDVSVGPSLRPADIMARSVVDEYVVGRLRNVSFADLTGFLGDPASLGEIAAALGRSAGRHLAGENGRDGREGVA